MAEAWEAALAGRLRVAEKLARAAIVGSEVNPRLWLDLGGILRRCGSVADAEEALRRAIAIAPTFGAAFAELAALQAAEGKWAAAERLQRRAVELLPHDAGARARLAEFTASVPADAGSEPENAAVMPPVLARTERFDWAEIGAGLRERGGAVLPALLSADECADLTALWSRDVFESASTASGGGAESRFLQRPFPTPLDALRTELYARLVPIAVEWQRASRRGSTPCARSAKPPARTGRTCGSSPAARSTASPTRAARRAGSRSRSASSCRCAHRVPNRCWSTCARGVAANAASRQRPAMRSCWRPASASRRSAGSRRRSRCGSRSRPARRTGCCSTWGSWSRADAARQIDSRTSRAGAGWRGSIGSCTSK